MPTVGWPRLSPRKEALILLPASLLVLLGLSAFTLASYRQALARWTAARRDATLEQARTFARALPAHGATASELARLRSQAPRARAVALLDAEGLPVAVAGDTPAPQAAARLPSGGGEFVGGPDRSTGGAVVAIVPLDDGARRFLRVDHEASALAAQRRALPLLFTLVMAIHAGLLLLLLLFLRHFFAPLDWLLNRARAAAGRDEQKSEDEVAFLLDTFERALAALNQRAAPAESSIDDDIGAVQRTLSPSLASGLLLLDRHGAVLALNPIGCTLLDLAEPAPGSTLEQTLLPHPSLRRVLGECLARGEGVQRLECPVQVRGAELVLGLTVHPLRPKNEIRGWMVLFADLTHALEAARAERLAQSLGQIGELAAGLAHELRNSLASLRGYLTLLDREPQGQNAGEYLSEMRLESSHLQRVLEDFLSFARPGSARLERITLRTVVDRALGDPALLPAPPGGFEVNTALPAEATLLGDAQLLERALRNLLHNAARAHRESDSREPIVIALEQRGPRLIATVSDRGPGVSPALRDRLFVPFQSASPGGVGLGLAVALRIVELHQGALRLEDRAGGGTHAIVALPCDPSVTEDHALAAGNAARPADSAGV